MVHAVFVRLAFRIVHGERHTQRRVFRQVCVRGFGFRAVILCTVLRFLVGAHADLVGFVCGKVFGRIGCNCVSFDGNAISAHGQRHVDGGGVPVNVVTEAGIDPFTIIVLLIDRHAIATGIVDRSPFSFHDLVAGGLQRNRRRSVRLLSVRIRDHVAELLAVDGGQRFFHLAVIIKIRFLFHHQEGGHIVFARRSQRAISRNSNRDFVGICYRLLVDQIVRAALFCAQIGTQDILCILYGIIDFARYLIAAQRQIQFFKRCNGKALRFSLYKSQRACADLVATAFRQPQHRHAVAFLIRVILQEVNVRVDGCIGINLTVLAHPSDDDRIVLALFLNRQDILDLLFGDRVIKRQQDIRRFVWSGIHLDLLGIPAAVFRCKGFRRQQCHGILLAVLQRRAIHRSR